MASDKYPEQLFETLSPTDSYYNDGTSLWIPIEFLKEYGGLGDDIDLDPTTGDGVAIVRALLQGLLTHQIYAEKEDTDVPSGNMEIRKFTGGSLGEPTETFMVKFTGNSGTHFI